MEAAEATDLPSGVAVDVGCGVGGVTLVVEHIERDRLRSDAGWHLRHVRLVARRVPNTPGIQG